MKYFIGIFIIAWVPLFMWSCNKIDNYNEIVSKDMSKPDPITNVEVHNFAGGAYITYDLPKNENLLYVFAKYHVNDSMQREAKASSYSDTLKLEGFDKSRDYEVVLYAVSRSEVKSDPVQVNVHPDEPAYLLAFPTISIEPGFGGAHVLVTNSLELPIGVVVISPDNDGKWVLVKQVNSDRSMVSIDIRGYDVEEREFGIFIVDPWNNKSDTLFKTIIPIFEAEIDKSKYRDYTLPSDATPYDASWLVPNLWDGDLGKGYHTKIPSTMPTTFTFGLGVKTKLSRFKLWQRGGEFIGAFGNPKRFAIWGSNNLQDDILPHDVSTLEAGDQVGNWIFLGYFESPDKPSGLPPGQNTEEDIVWNDIGLDFSFEGNIPAVEYIRFQGFESYGLGDFIHIMEMSFWGE